MNFLHASLKWEDLESAHEPWQVQFDEARNVLERSLNITERLGKDSLIAAETLRVMGRLSEQEVRADGPYIQCPSLVQEIWLEQTETWACSLWCDVAMRQETETLIRQTPNPNPTTKPGSCLSVPLPSTRKH